jgi:hypothetical protein
MCNLVRAAEEGWQGSVADALDYKLASPFAARAAVAVSSML